LVCEIVILMVLLSDEPAPDHIEHEGVGDPQPGLFRGFGLQARSVKEARWSRTSCEPHRRHTSE
jgi:hypothetical protein